MPTSEVIADKPVGCQRNDCKAFCNLIMLLSTYTLENQCKTKPIVWLLEKTPCTPSPSHRPYHLSKHTIITQKQPSCEWTSYLCQDIITCRIYQSLGNTCPKIVSFFVGWISLGVHYGCDNCRLCS